MTTRLWSAALAAALASGTTFAQAPVRAPAPAPARSIPVPATPGPAVQVPVVPPPPPVVGAPLPALQPLTLDQARTVFAAPAPGKYHAVFIHPTTNCPVAVDFCLKCACYEVKCHKFLGVHKLVFKAKGHDNDVVLKFKKDGSVVVNGA